jgi:hypothetical protein
LFPQRETIKDRHEIVVQGKQRNTKIRRICCTRKEKEYKIEDANDLVAAGFCSNTYTQKNVTIFGCKQLGYYAGGMMKTRVKNRRQKKLTNKTKARE